MVPSPNALEFVARVPNEGFQWVTLREWRELRNESVKRAPAREDDPRFEPGSEASGPFLVYRGDRDSCVLRQPGKQPALFREFSELDTRDHDSLAAFADAYGWLYQTKTFNCHPPAELFSIWQFSVWQMRAAVTVLDAIRNQDTVTLRRLFTWKPRPFSAPEGVPSYGWTFDTHPDRPYGEKVPGRVCGFTVSTTHTGQESVMTIARARLATEVNSRLDGEVNLRLVVTEDGNDFAESLVPMTLLAAMWSQFFEAVTQDVSHKKCRACGRWFAIGGRATGTRRRSSDRKVYCTDLCRVRACQGRRERAQELAAKGMTPAVVVKAMQDEGHETDFATVKKWVRGIKRKGG